MLYFAHPSIWNLGCLGKIQKICKKFSKNGQKQSKMAQKWPKMTKKWPKITQKWAETPRASILALYVLIWNEENRPEGGCLLINQKNCQFSFVCKSVKFWTFVEFFFFKTNYVTWAMHTNAFLISPGTPRHLKLPPKMNHEKTSKIHVFFIFAKIKAFFGQISMRFPYPGHISMILSAYNEKNARNLGGSFEI